MSITSYSINFIIISWIYASEILLHSIIMFIILSQLFDFDIEVRPILEVLVGKTVEQSLLEVMEEEELASLRAQQVCCSPTHVQPH